MKRSLLFFLSVVMLAIFSAFAGKRSSEDFLKYRVIATERDGEGNVVRYQVDPTDITDQSQTQHYNCLPSSIEFCTVELDIEDEPYQDESNFLYYIDAANAEQEVPGVFEPNDD